MTSYVSVRIHLLLYAREPTAPGVSAHDASVMRLADTLNQLLAPYDTYSGSAIQTQRVMTYAPRYRLAFTLLNEDAASGDGALDWDVQNAIQSKAHLLSLAAHKELNAHYVAYRPYLAATQKVVCPAQLHD